MTVWSAPIPFTIMVAGVAFAIWQAMQWRYGGIIERLGNDVSWAKSQLERATEERPRHPATAVPDQPAQPRATETLAPRIAAPSPEQASRRLAGINENGERVFLPGDMTLEKLMELAAQKPRSISNDRLVEAHKRMWAPFSGIVSSSGFHEGEIIIRLKAEGGENLREVIARTTNLWFQRWPDSLEHLSEGDTISGIGLIEDVDYSGVTLTGCELNG